MGEVKLTTFGRKLSTEAQGIALERASVAGYLEKARDQLYPGVPPLQWTEEQRDEIWTLAEKWWAEDQRKTVGG